MKNKLLGAIGALVLGAALGVAIPRAADAALLCTPGNVVGAGSCTETVQFGPAPADFLNQGLFLDKWVSNAFAGFTQTLTGVTYSEGGTRPLSATVTNQSSSTQTLNFTLSGSLSFQAGAGSPSNFLPSVVTFTGTFDSPDFILGPGASSPTTILDFSFGPTAPVVNTTGLASYIGPGTFEALVSTGTDFEFGAGETNVSATITKSATANITITYDFITTTTTTTPVPEPASLLMLGSGLAGLVVVIRWRRRAPGG